MIELEVEGSYYAMGREHARQVQAQRLKILEAIAARQAELDRIEGDATPRLRELAAFLAEFGHPTWEMMRGIADGLGLEWALMQRYTFSAYLLDAHRATAAPQEGCTTFAASAPATRDGAPLLAKNRDYRRDHLALQTLTRSRPAHGYRSVHLGSAGSPGVFSSGMNERGLAVADTHVLSRDLGPGLPRYALMLDLLERCPDVPAALDYLRGVTHMGGGTMILADAEGHLAVCESGHRSSGYIARSDGWLVSTNHFTTAGLREQWIESDPPEFRGNSQARRAYVEQALARAAGEVDAGWAQALLSDHQTGLDCLCRHERPGSTAETILATVFLPHSRQLLFGAGTPCAAEWVHTTNLW
ncbi:MAG: C45 family peptidase [Ardenticatenaceae bacterium]|nr:C45 family peptidase [Ardenticatenaceae bacterium]